ncbi:hypothetical protein OAD75_06115 [Gammaproteobacteria bacterium]|nr:hypothetical protein [Gammaproteobacteria bacterium]
MKDNKFLNFMGDDDNYVFNPKMPNPYGLRGNPDNNANCQNNDCYEGDGLNGTPAHFNSNDRVYEYPPANFNSFDGSQWSNDGTETTGWNNATGFWSGLFDRDGMTTYYTCTDGSVSGQRFETGKQPSGWVRNSNNACLSSQEIANRKANKLTGINNLLDNINTGLQTGLQITNPNSPNYQPEFSNQNDNNNVPLTTTTIESGIGTTGKVIGVILVVGVVLSVGYIALNKK